MDSHLGGWERDTVRSLGRRVTTIKNLWGLCSPAPGSLQTRPGPKLGQYTIFMLHLTIFSGLWGPIPYPAHLLCLAHGLATLYLEMPSDYSHLLLPQGCLHLLSSAPAGSLPRLRPARPSRECKLSPCTLGFYSRLFIYSYCSRPSVCSLRIPSA